MIGDSGYVKDSTLKEIVDTRRCPPSYAVAMARELLQVREDGERDFGLARRLEAAEAVCRFFDGVTDEYDLGDWDTEYAEDLLGRLARWREMVRLPSPEPPAEGDQP